MVRIRRFFFPRNVQREVYHGLRKANWAIHGQSDILRCTGGQPSNGGSHCAMACHGPWLYHGPSKDHWAPHSEAWPKFPSLFRKSSTLCGMWHGSDLLRIHPNRRFRIVFDFNLFQKVAFGGIFWKKNRGIDTMRSLCHKATCWGVLPPSWDLSVGCCHRGVHQSQDRWLVESMEFWGGPKCSSAPFWSDFNAVGIQASGWLYKPRHSQWFCKQVWALHQTWQGKGVRLWLDKT